MDILYVANYFCFRIAQKYIKFTIMIFIQITSCTLKQNKILILSNENRYYRVPTNGIF